MNAAVQNTWRAVPVPSPRSDDALPAMSGHAACAVLDKIYLYGGRQNRKYLQRTYVFDTGAPLLSSCVCLPCASKAGPNIKR